LLTTFASFYERVVIRHPAAVLAGLTVILIVSLFGIPKFKLDASSDSLTLESDRALDYFREITSRYNSGDILIVTYKPEEELFSDPSLDRLESLRDDLLAVQGVDGVTSILDVPMLYSPPLSFRDLSDDLPRLRDDSVDKQLAQQEFHRNPIYKDTLVGPDNQTTAILLNLAINHELLDMVRERDALYIERRNDDLDAQEAQRLEQLETEYLQARTLSAQKDAERDQAIRDIVAEYEKGADMFVGGATMITSDMISFIKSDLVTFGIGILAFILFTLIVIFRHPKLVLLPLCTCVVTAAMMLGLLGWLDWRLTVISSNFVSLLLIITMAITIHLVVRYQENCRVESDQPQTRLVMDTVSQMGRPCFYTAITTIVAFVSLVVSDIRPVIDFGWMMTIGVAMALVVTFLIVPAGLLVMGGIGKSNIGPEDPRYMSWLARQVLRFPTTILVVATIVAAISFYGISQLKVENRFIDYFKDDTEIHQGMLIIDNQLGGTMSLDVVLSAPENWDDYLTTDGSSEGFEDDPFADDFDSFDEDPFVSEDETAGIEESYWWNGSGFRTVERYHDFLEAQPEIGKVTSIATMYKVARDLLDGELNDIELAFMRQSLSDELRDTLIEPYYDPELQQVRISTRVKESVQGLSRDELIQRVENFGEEELGIESENVQTTGLIVLYNNMLQSLFSSQIKTLGAVFFAIMIMFMALFRSLLISAIAMIPNMLAAVVVLGIMGLAGIPLDIMTITIAAITVGMGVDHEIHYIHRFRHEYAQVKNYTEALKRSHRTIGRALLYTAITIIVGFSVLALSNFIPSIYFGLLASLAMVAATILSLMLLPRLLVLVKPFGKEES
jgi:uncharacterized protein